MRYILNGCFPTNTGRSEFVENHQLRMPAFGCDFSRSRDKKNPAEAGFLDLNCKLSIRLSAGLWMTSPDFTSI
jgi:hypothetical protein